MSTLLSQHIVNPFNHRLDQLETWSAAAALAEATDRIEIIAAIKPLLWSLLNCDDGIDGSTRIETGCRVGLAILSRRRP